MTNRYLPTALRRALEKTVKDARLIAEEGTRDAIRRLGVADSKAPSYLNDDEKELRRRLRAHARALGDASDKSDETQETKRLVEAAAYAYWHRMLFARFLAERSLLRNPEYDVPVSLEDCRELAEAEGLTDPWVIAERYAASMLPAVFRIDDPVLSIELDPVQTQELHRLVMGLDAEVFQAEDSLGWTYQFWRTAEKKAVNDSGMKIGADELPAVTQLFTEPYMVRFLLHNTLGGWWAGTVLAADPMLARTAADENALRAACSLPRLQLRHAALRARARGWPLASFGWNLPRLAEGGQGDHPARPLLRVRALPDRGAGDPGGAAPDRRTSVTGRCRRSGTARQSPRSGDRRSLRADRSVRGRAERMAHWRMAHTTPAAYRVGWFAPAACQS